MFELTEKESDHFKKCATAAIATLIYTRAVTKLDPISNPKFEACANESITAAEIFVKELDERGYSPAALLDMLPATLDPNS